MDISPSSRTVVVVSMLQLGDGIDYVDDAWEVAEEGEQEANLELELESGSDLIGLWSQNR